MFTMSVQIPNSLYREKVLLSLQISALPRKLFVRFHRSMVLQILLSARSSLQHDYLLPPFTLLQKYSLKEIPSSLQFFHGYRAF